MPMGHALANGLNDDDTHRRPRSGLSWLGLVPRQQSSGGKAVLLGISKRGDRSLRTLLLPGARAVWYRTDAKKRGRSW
jgi:transposase